MPKGSKPPAGTAQEDAGGAPLERSQAPSEAEEPAPAGAPQTPGGDEPPAAEPQRPAEPPGEPAQPAAEASGGQVAAPEQDQAPAPAAGGEPGTAEDVPQTQDPAGQPQFPQQMSPAEQQVAGGDPDVALDSEQTGKEPGPGASDSPGQPKPLGQSGALASHPDAGTEEGNPVMVPATSNESPSTAPHPAAAAGKALAALGKIGELARKGGDAVGEIMSVAAWAEEEISGQVPPHVAQVAGDEVNRRFPPDG